MNAKEKALQMCQKFGWLGTKWEQTQYYTLKLENAKECALIAVNEIILSNPHSNPLNSDIHSTMDFWNEVKKEITNL
jgi:hypothetical protein